jgi:5-methylcytosine-specific restriction endonuclease McrA
LSKSHKNLSIGENHPMFGKTHTEEAKKKMSESSKGHKGLTGKNNGMYGKRGIESPNWKGGYDDPLYNTYVPQLEWCEEVRRNENDSNVLEVKCFKCGKWFIPTSNNVSNRIQYLKGNYKSESTFYCSNECKNSCSVYKKSPEQIERQDAVRVGRLSWLELIREVQSELREMVLERDKNQCVKCESTNDLQCHHILPVNIEPLLSADVDNCITLCKECHIEAHKKDGCKYYQLKIEEC